MTRPSPALALLFLGLFFGALGGAVAGPVEDLARLVREARATPNPTMALLRGLAGLPDFDLPEAELRRALTLAQVPAGDPLDRLLRPTTRLTKSGDRISAARREATLVTMPDGAGAIELGRNVRVRLRVLGPHDAALDRVSGIRVGPTASDLYSLFEVRFTRQAGRPVAVVTAGVDLLLTSITRTVTIDLAPAPVTASSGLAGALER